ncbi:Coiled-coil domain-containing protein 34 [Holothuria leucospilota]|uniref:Coiled-coil domain-containing protein 34 n=1 Tax=Holothuria leucospilota TaxID=206669 RepID=A0A9Q1BSG0_HOLLE|nr:Coiled-coil domain-containing protein 34 [Holothuria leucospilota]
MEQSQSSEVSHILHSTPKGDKSDNSQTKSSVSKHERVTPPQQNNYTDTFSSTSRTFSKSPSSPYEGKKSPHSLDNTGDSTRSLLSVLSHSSVDSLSSGSISDSLDKRSPLQNAAGSDVKENSSKTTTTPSKNEPGGSEAELTPWEKWLIEKSKSERKKVKEEVRKKLEALKAKEEEEEKKKEHRRLVERRVLNWLKEKEIQEKKQRAKEERKKRAEQKKKLIERQTALEKEKTNREEWMAKKKEEELQQKQKALEERQRKAQEEWLKKEKAEEAFKKWKQQAKGKAKPCTGSFYEGGYIRSSGYPVPSYCNPIPWMPPHTPPQQTSKETCKRRKSSNLERIPPSPPLLFKDRTNKDHLQRRGRPR